MPLTSTVEIRSSWPQFGGSGVYDGLRTRADFAMPSEKARFPRTIRLLRHADFERVYKQGRRHFSASMTVFYRARVEEQTKTRAGARTVGSSVPPCPPQPRPAQPGLRVGFTVGRALGGAVQRNRMKRRLREAVRLSGPPATVAADVVINPKKSLLKADFADVVNEVRRGFAVIEQKLSGKTTAATASNAGSRAPETGSQS